MYQNQRCTMTLEGLHLHFRKSIEQLQARLVREEKNVFDYCIIPTTLTTSSWATTSTRNLVIPERYHHQVRLAECQAKYMQYGDAIESLLYLLNPQALTGGMHFNIFTTHSNRYSFDARTVSAIFIDYKLKDRLFACDAVQYIRPKFDRSIRM